MVTKTAYKKDKIFQDEKDAIRTVLRRQVRARRRYFNALKAIVRASKELTTAEALYRKSTKPLSRRKVKK